MLTQAGCAGYMAPTPATLENSVYSQNASNIILHSVSDLLRTQELYRGFVAGNYTVVFALSLQNKPAAVSVLSATRRSPYFINLLKSSSISETIFSNTSDVIHGSTTITKVSYNSIYNLAAREYLTSVGFNKASTFLVRTTYFYKNQETLTVIDYVIPSQKSNSLKD